MKTETKKFSRVPVASWENAESGDTIGKEQAKHTPLPWEANKWASGWEVCAPDSHYSIARLGGCNNAENNARLIAAAPDLLEAIKGIQDLAKYADGAFNPDIIKICATAIQKAGGVS